MRKEYIKIKKTASLASFFFIFLSLATPAHAQDVDCIADGLAEYIIPVFDALGEEGSGNVKFLTPAFNMTNEHFPEFATKLNAALSDQSGGEYDLGSFYRTAGNAYNTSWGNVTDFINTANGTPAGANPIILTETGWYPHETDDKEGEIEKLKEELNNASNLEGALIFNIFGSNSQFAAQSMSDEEVQSLCDNNCQGKKIGGNSAVYFYNDPNFYERASQNNLAYTLEIANYGDVQGSVKRGIEDSPGIPIVRLGVGRDSGGFENPRNLISFINTINDYTNKTVYVIIGSNEPLTECWATPNCNCSTTEGQSPGLVDESWPEDSAHFYVNTKGQEDLISKVNSLIKNYSDMDFDGSPGGISNPIPGSVPDYNDRWGSIDSIMEHVRKDSYIEYAQNISQITGVRASLILALIHTESSFQQFPGDGRYPDDVCEHPNCRSMGLSCEPFENVWLSVGHRYSQYTINTIPISSAGNNPPHCGGAMGPAQVMAFNWPTYEPRIRDVVGRSPSPWEFEDAITFAGLFLADKGAQTKICADEAGAILSYKGSGYGEDLAWQTVALANEIAQEIGEDSCVGAEDRVVGPGDWKLPLANTPLKITADADDHKGRSPAAWDFSATVGTVVYPTKEGVVTFASCTENGYGCWAKINHGTDESGNSWESLYAHFGSPTSYCYNEKCSAGFSAGSDCRDSEGILVNQWDEVSPENPLGKINLTGCTTGGHLHFEIRKNGVSIDPIYIFEDYVKSGDVYFE